MFATREVAGRGRSGDFEIGTVIPCTLLAATAAGIACGYVLRSLFRRYGVAASACGVVAIPLFYVPDWTLAVGAIMAGAFLIWLTVRWINRRDGPRRASCPSRGRSRETLPAHHHCEFQRAETQNG